MYSSEFRACLEALLSLTLPGKVRRLVLHRKLALPSKLAPPGKVFLANAIGSPARARLLVAQACSFLLSLVLAGLKNHVLAMAMASATAET